MRRKLKRHGRNGQRMLVPKAREDENAVKKEVEDLRKLAKTHMLVPKAHEDEKAVKKEVEDLRKLAKTHMLVPKAHEDENAVKKEVEDLRKLAKTHMIVAILIATVNDSKDTKGRAVLAHEVYFQAFIVSDTLAMALSFCAIYVYFMASTIEDKRKLIKCYSIARTMVTVSAQAMVFAFLCGVYVVLQHTVYLKVFVPIIGILTFLCFFITASRIYNRS